MPTLLLNRYHWQRSFPTRLALFAVLVCAAILCTGCASVDNGRRDGGGWFAPKPPESPQTIEDFMKLKRLDP